MLKRSTFFFLRHGETDWNKEHRAQGQRDISLNSKGWEQARDACELVRGLPIATVCTSPLRRAYDTALLIRSSLGCTLEVISDLTECCWGDQEGHVKGQWFEDWKSGSNNPSGAEPYEHFLERALRGINEALDRPGPVLIVSHGGVYWSVLKHAALGDEFDVPNAVPVRHDPPREGFPFWTAEILELAR